MTNGLIAFSTVLVSMGTWPFSKKTRSAEFLRELLANYRGRVLTDGYASYDSVLDELGLVHAACHTHCRRNFVEAHEVAKDTRAAVRAR